VLDLSTIVPVFILDPATAIGLLWLAALLLILGFAASIALMAIDRRQIERESVWAKPAKFYLALALHFATLAIIAGWLTPAWQASPILGATAWLAVIATGAEMAYITIQAARAERSHFNLGTPFHATLYGLMAFGAVIITMAAGVVGVLVLFDPAGLPGPAARIGAITGLIGGTALTLVTAFRMGAALSRHAGMEPEDAPRMPLTGWSLTVGDRRVPHFFATHMMQILPVFGVLADLLVPSALAAPITAAAALAYAALTLFIYAQTNAGRPLLRISRPTRLPA